MRKTTLLALVAIGLVLGATPALADTPAPDVPVTSCVGIVLDDIPPVWVDPSCIIPPPSSPL